MAGTATNIPGISSLGVKFGYAVETTKGTKPTKFIQLERCNTINGISLETETIDASALEDMQTRSIAGRQDTGGTWAVTFNFTPDVAKQLKKMIQAAKTGKTSSFNTWFEVWNPNTPDNAFFVVAEPPALLPMPEVSQNGLQTIELTFTINEYKGDDEGIEPEIEDTTL